MLPMVVDNALSASRTLSGWSKYLVLWNLNQLDRCVAIFSFDFHGVDDHAFFTHATHFMSPAGFAVKVYRASITDEVDAVGEFPAWPQKHIRM